MNGIWIWVLQKSLLAFSKSSFLKKTSFVDDIKCCIRSFVSDKPYLPWDKAAGSFLFATSDVLAKASFLQKFVLTVWYVSYPLNVWSSSCVLFLRSGQKSGFPTHSMESLTWQVCVPVDWSEILHCQVYCKELKLHFKTFGENFKIKHIWLVSSRS